DRALSAIDALEFPRSRAYVMLGLAHAYPALREVSYAAAFRRLADTLVAGYEESHDGDWAWFEPEMTYDNARLCEALLRAGQALGEPRYTDLGLVTLGFYEQITTVDGIFVPIGNRGWYRHAGRRAIYDQQPLEAYATIDAQLAAHDATSDQ